MGFLTPVVQPLTRSLLSGPVDLEPKFLAHNPTLLIDFVKQQYAVGSNLTLRPWQDLMAFHARASKKRYNGRCRERRTADDDQLAIDYDPTTGAPRGVLLEGSSTNLFLNSLTPATQSVTVTNSTEYTVSCIGSGSLALSGAGTGTVTEGSPVTFTSSTTSLTCTASGSLDEAQVEPGSLATSIIATAGTSATRAADVLTLTNLGVWYDSAGGAIYVEVQRNGSLGSNFPFVARLGDSNDDIDILFQSSTGLLYGSVRAGGAIQGSSGVVVNQTNLNKIAFAFQDDDLMAGVNGSLGDADLSATIPTGLTEATIGSAGGLNPTEGFIRRFMYFPSRVPNATLQAWTA